MLDIMEFNKALKITWILKYISDDCQSKWKSFVDFYLSKFGGKLIFTGNLARKDVKSLNVKDSFLLELNELWSVLNYRDSFASQADFDLKMWRILIGGQFIYYPGNTH